LEVFGKSLGGFPLFKKKDLIFIFDTLVKITATTAILFSD